MGDGHIQRISSGSPYEAQIGYARAVVAGEFVFISGTTGLDPDNPGEQSVSEQCARTLARIGAALEAAGVGFEDVVQVRYILPDRQDFETCWTLLRDRFGAAPPTATMIVAGLIDPRMKIEIEVVARRPE